MIGFFLKQRLSHLTRSFSKENLGRLATAFLFLCVVALVSVGVYALLSSGFSSVAENEFLRIALPYFVYEMFLLTVFALVFSSALITGLFLLFKQESDAWVLVSPSHTSLLTEKLVSVMLASIWPLLVIALPALIAMQTVFSIGFSGVLIGLFIALVLGVLAVVSALLLLLLVAAALYHVGMNSAQRPGFGWLLSLTGGTTLALFGLSWYRLSDLELLSLFDAQNLEIAQANITNITEYFAIFPSHIAAEALLAMQTGASEQVLASVLLLTALAAALLYAFSLFSQSFLSLWQYFQEGSFEARSVSASKAQSKSASGRFPSSPIAAVFRKEWLTMIRDKRTLFWLGFLSLLWLIVTGFDIIMQNALDGNSVLEAVTVPQFIQLLQIVVIGYFVAALVLRLVFPAFSMERDTAWSIMTAPVTLTRLFWAKAVFHVAVIGSIALLISLIHIIILSSSLSTTLLFILYTMVVSITLTLTGLGIGARFPNFTTSDPEALSTTLPGLAFVGIALLYCSAAAYSYYLVFSGVGAVSIAGFLLLSVLMAVFFCILALRHLPQTDFAARVES